MDWRLPIYVKYVWKAIDKVPDAVGSHDKAPVIERLLAERVDGPPVQIREKLGVFGKGLHQPRAVFSPQN